MMSSLKHAALLGFAGADRTLSAPAYGSAPVYSAPAGAYAMSAEAFAQPMEVVQPVEYVNYVPAEPTSGADSQFWLWTGVGALAARSGGLAQPSAVADLDAADLESARIATLAVGGKKGKDQQGGLLSWLMSGRKSFDGKTESELELLSGAARPGALQTLNKRFEFGYDTRPKAKAKAKAKPKAGGKQITTWRSSKPTTGLYK